MSRIVPSQVVSVIDTIVAADRGMARTNSSISVDFSHSSALQGILDIARSVPEELLVLGAEDYTKLTCARAAIENAITISQGRTFQENSSVPMYLTPIPGFGDLNPIFLLRDALEKCPDEYPSPTTSELLFLEPDYRDVLRVDISAVNKALNQGEWKAATVLAGSVVEALLLWAIKKKPDEAVADVVASLVAAKTLGKTLPTDLDWWNLSQFVEVAFGLKLTGEATAQQIRLAKDFRNLIHPGKSLRERQECNRGTALSAVSAVEHVVTDLKKTFPPVP